MKKHLHYLWAAFLAAAALPAAAQTQDSPQVIKVGENTVTTQDAYFTFTPTEDCMVRLEGCYVSSYASPGLTATIDGETTKVGSAYSSFGDIWMVFNAEAGVTYSFDYTNWNTPYTINCTVTPREGSATGETCEDPLVFSAEGQALFPFIYDPVTYADDVAYAKYVCEKDGRLVITTTDSFRNLYIGTSCDDITEYVSGDYATSGYTYEVEGVEAGDVIYMKGSGTTSLIATVEVVEVVPGASCKDAITIVDGQAMEIPAAAGTYWYKATNPNAYWCALVVSSDCKATAELSNGCSYNGVKYDSLNFRSNPIDINSTRWLKIVKAEDTASPETFTATFDKLLPIEDDQVGEPVTVGVAMTTPSKDATPGYYYSVTAPADKPMLLVIKSNADSELYTQYSPAIKVTELGGYQSLTYGNPGMLIKMQTTPGMTYLLTVQAKNDIPVTFTVDFEPLEEGSLSTYPIEMGLETAEVPAFSPVYYHFSPEVEAKVEVSCDIEGATITAQSGTEGWSGVSYYTLPLNSGENGLWFKAQVGTHYMFTVSKPEGEETATGTFTLAQAPFGPGESWTTAIEASEGELILPDGPSEVWYKITAAQDGYLTMTDITMNYNWENAIQAYPGVVAGNPATPELGYNDNGSFYESLKVGVAKDQVVYLYFKNTLTQTAPSVVLGYENAEAGTIPATAYELEYSEDMAPVAVSGKLGYNQFVWYSIELPEGMVSITSPNQLNVTLYKADNTNQGLTTGSWNSGKDYGVLGFGIEAGKYYFTVSGTDSYSNPVEEIEFSISVREPLPGETVATAIEITEPTEEEYVPALDGVYYWFKIEANPGELTILSEDNQSFYANLYDSAEANNIVEESGSFKNEETGDYYCGIKNFNVTEANTYYFCVYYSNNGATLTFSGSALAGAVAPVVPESYEISLDVEGLELTQGEEYGVYTVNVAGTTDADSYTLTVEVPEGWDGFVGITDAEMNGGVDPLKVKQKAYESEWVPLDMMLEYGYKKTNTLTFPVDGEEHSGSLMLYKGDQVDEMNQILVFTEVSKAAVEPEFPTDLDIVASDETLMIEQNYDPEEMDALQVVVSGTSATENFTLTFNLPEGWESVVLVPMNVGGFSMNEWPTLDQFEESMEGQEFLTGTTFEFTAPTRMAMFTGYLVADGKVNVENGFMLGLDVDFEKTSVAVNVEVEDGASFAYNVPLNTETSFALNLPENFEVASAMLNGEEIEVAPNYTVVAGEEDYDYVFVVEYSGDLEFVDTTTGMVMLDTTIAIGIDKGQIRVDNTVAGDVVTVYTVGGMMVGQHVAQSTAVLISMPKGTYIVVVNKNAAKVVL